MNDDRAFLRAMHIEPAEFPAPALEPGVVYGEAFSGYTLDGEPAVVMTQDTYASLVAANHGLHEDLQRSRSANADLAKDRAALMTKPTRVERWMWAVLAAASVAAILAARAGQ